MSSLAVKIKEFWPIYAAAFLSRVIGIVSRFILARFFLGPQEFGLFASVLVIAEIVILLGEAGCKKSIVVLKGNQEEKILGTVYSFMTIYNLLLLAIVYLLASQISLWLGLADEGAYIRTIIPFVTLFNLSQIAAGSLNKRRKFIYQIRAQLTGSILFLLIAVTMAYFEKGVMSLILAQGFSLAAQGIVTFLSLGLKFRLSIDSKIFNNFIRVGASSLFANFQEFLGRNYDNLIIAIFCAKTELGNYFLAFTIISIPIVMIKAPLSEYMFSVISQHRSDAKKIKEFYFACRSWDLHFIVPILGSLALLSGPFVEFVLGNKWLDTSRFILGLIPYSFMWAIGANTQTLLALGKIKLSNQVVLLRTVLLLFILPISAEYFSIKGIIWAISSIMAISLFAGNAILLREIRANVSDYLKAFRWGFVNLVLGLLLYGMLRVSNLTDGLNGFLFSVISFSIPIAITTFIRKPNLKK